jgi:hypothetical protein
MCGDTSPKVRGGTRANPFYVVLFLVVTVRGRDFVVSCLSIRGRDFNYFFLFIQGVGFYSFFLFSFSRRDRAGRTFERIRYPCSQTLRPDATSRGRATEVLLLPLNMDGGVMNVGEAQASCIQ